MNTRVAEHYSDEGSKGERKKETAGEGKTYSHHGLSSGNFLDLRINDGGPDPTSPLYVSIPTPQPPFPGIPA